MSQVPATQDQWASTGLEDFAVTDAVLPRIKIDHPTGQWVDSLGGQPMETLVFVALGLVKQRVLFHHVVDNGDVPMCKSSDFNFGFPNREAPTNKSFPWELSGFDPNDFPADPEGNRKLPCGSCKLKDWDSSPVNGNPYCSEQWTLPIYYEVNSNPNGTEWAPAILTLQKSSIKPIRSYFTTFAQSNKPPFVMVGQGTLKVQQRGSVVYSTPTFVKVQESDRSRWGDYSSGFQEMRTYLTRPPVPEAPEGAAQPDQPVDNSWQQAPVQQAPVQQAPVQQAPAPVQQAPVQQAPAPVQQAPAPVQQAPAPVQQAPVQQAPAPVQQEAPPVQQAPAPASPPPVPAGQGLPF